MAIETNELIDVKTLSPFKRFIMTIGNLPTSYLESMTYGEMLMWFCNYLQETVIPTVNNNAEAVEELQNLYEELKQYVDDYFTNLDVQEEINNKLDTMAQDGSLTNLIKNYVDPIYQAYEQVINNEVNEINTKVNDLASGSPLVASSTDEMTETDRVYVNTTDGKWYYYDGDSWEIGGTYQAAEIETDTTLTESDVPADAKVVGDYVLSNFTNYKSRNIIDPTNTKSGYTTQAGVYGANDSYLTLIEPIDVSAYHGKTLYFSKNNVQQYMRYVTAYDSDREVVTDEGVGSNTYTYTVPDDIDYINITFTTPVTSAQLEVDRITTISTYFNKEIVNTNNNVKTNVFKCYNESIDIPNLNEIKTFNTIYNKKNFCINFFGKITGTFTGLRIGQGLNNSIGYNIHITDTGVSYQYNETDGSPVSHNLTIKDYISVNIYIDNDIISHITINTNGGTWTRNVVPWNGCTKDIFVKPDSGTNITNAKLSYNAEDSKKFIWYCGDSYISAGNTRIPYWLNQLNVGKNLMLDGFAGAASTQIRPDMEKLIDTLGYKPKYLIWALGMNDGDSNAINTGWFANFSIIRDLCDKYEIELIACTIPNTPLIDNTYKNAYIRSCGVKYVDYSEAVNTNINNNTWLDGMLSSDNVHPTSEGAKCLANKLVSSFPEIFY